MEEEGPEVVAGTPLEAGTPAVDTLAGTRVARTPPESPLARGMRAGTSGGCTSGLEGTAEMRNPQRLLLAMLHRRRQACGTFPRQCADHPFRGFRQPFSGLHHHGGSAAKFCWSLRRCVLIAASSSIAFGRFLPPDVS